LQQLEVQVLGESSTGFKNNEAAQQSPGVIAVVTSSSLRLPSSGTSLQCCETQELSAAYSMMLPYTLAVSDGVAFALAVISRHAPIP